VTVKNMVENIRQVFPQIGETQVLKEIDKAQKEFATETEILSAHGELSAPSTNISWSLPSSCASVYSIEAFDSDELPVDLSDESITYTIDQGVLTFIDTDETVITGLPTTIDSIYINYYEYPTLIDGVSDSLDIPEKFHPAIEHKVLETLYSRFPTLTIQSQQGVSQSVDWNAVKYHNGEYNRLRVEAKKYKNINQDQIPKTYSYDFLGNPSMISRTKPGSGGTIIAPLSSVYSKYVRVVATSPSTTSVGIPYGFGTISTSIVAGVVYVTSSAEFTPTMFINTNQGINYSYISTSSIEFYPPASWGTLVIEIYES